jgi:hypothetical protein
MSKRDIPIGNLTLENTITVEFSIDNVVVSANSDFYVLCPPNLVADLDKEMTLQGRKMVHCKLLSAEATEHYRMERPDTNAFVVSTAEDLETLEAMQLVVVPREVFEKMVNNYPTPSRFQGIDVTFQERIEDYGLDTVTQLFCYICIGI